MNSPKKISNERAEKVFEGFMALQKALGTHKDKFFADYGLSRAQVHILYAIAHYSSVTVKDIAEKMGITSSAATQIIEGLVKLDFVERAQDKEDRRVVHLKFSKKGEAKFKAFKKDHMARFAQRIAVLTEQELELLMGIPEKILNNLAKNNE